jgi:outer membrane protein TolC
MFKEKGMRKQLVLLFLVFSVVASGQQISSNVLLQQLARRAVAKNQKVKVQEALTQRARIDKKKAYSAYLPKINVEASYTVLDAPLEYSADMQNLLLSTQKLLVKEGVAMATYGLPPAYKVEFGSPYTAAVATGGTLQDVVNAKVKPVPAIQEQQFAKANINGQMLLFSGLKVPYSIKAANHQIAANEYLTQSEASNLIYNLSAVVDQLAVIAQTDSVLKQTEQYLNNQKRVVEKAFANGLTISLNKQRIDLAVEQLNVKKIELETARRLVCMQIEEYTGMPADSVALLSPQMNEWSVETVVNSSANRPEIKALEEAIVATDYKRKAENAEYIPKVMAFGKKELIKDNLTMLDPQWYVGVGIKWTLFDGLSARQSASQTKIDREVLSLRRSEALEMSNIKLEKERLEMLKNKQLVETSRRQAQLSKNVLDMSQKQLEQGLITFPEHMTSINDYQKAALDVIQAIVRQRASAAGYLQAAGELNIESLK